MDKPDSIRIDKWMWAVRLFKTRTLAADACKGGKVKIEGVSVKSSKEVKIGDIISIQSGIITKKIKVTGISGNRMAAKLVVSFYEDLTPAEEYEKQKMIQAAQVYQRPHGLGRPTKKERRDLDSWGGEVWSD